jgi:hypothetical protein
MLALTGRLDYSYQSGRNSVVATASPAYFEIRGGALTGVHVSLGHCNYWEIALHVDNLLYQFVPLSGKALDGNTTHSVSAARPRTVTLSVSAELH